MPVMRLDKLLSGQGFGSRKEVKALLSESRILVNGRITKKSDEKIDTDTDEVTIDDYPVRYREHLYIMMNKPQGVISASMDPKDSTVIDLLPPELSRPGLFPAGRLDKDTEGLLIITDDGQFAHDILSPKKHVWKKYYAELDGPVGESEQQQFERGVVLEDGTPCLPAKLEIRSSRERSEVFVTIREGKYHQIKRMFMQQGRKVLYLKRISMGGVELDPVLEPGECRELSEKEIGFVKINQ